VSCDTRTADLIALLAEAEAGRPLSYYAGLPGAPSRITMLRAIDAGRLQAVRHAAGYRVEPAEYARWIESRRCVVGGSTATDSELVDRIVAEAPEISPERAARIARLVGGASA